MVVLAPGVFVLIPRDLEGGARGSGGWHSNQIVILGPILCHLRTCVGA